MSENTFKVMKQRNMRRISGLTEPMRILSQLGIYLFLFLMALIVLLLDGDFLAQIPCGIQTEPPDFLAQTGAFE